MGLLTFALAGSGPAHATLGEGSDSIAKDRKALSAVKRATTSHAKYSVQEVASDATVVREFLTPSGVVFAIAWKGLVPPDLTVLLGSYFDEYKEAKRQLPRKHGQRRSRVKGDRVVVETWGHMRNLQGRAYDPALVPTGVRIDEIH
ncbi:MAG TPA: hypothetical protein DDY22_17330 [Geobacter sp.]|nr:hypothetical protein [Geobacter sp.]